MTKEGDGKKKRRLKKRFKAKTGTVYFNADNDVDRIMKNVKRRLKKNDHGGEVTVPFVMRRHRVAHNGLSETEKK